MVAQLRYHSANVVVDIAQININDGPTMHSANATSTICPAPPPTPMPCIQNNATPHVITNDGIQMFYCWTHICTPVPHVPHVPALPMDIASQPPQPTCKGEKHHPSMWLPSLHQVHGTQDMRAREAGQCGSNP